MTISRLSALIERLFLILLVGACGFMVTYLRDITNSLDSIRAKVGIACEQVSAIEAGMRAINWTLERHDSELEKQRQAFDALHPRRG